MLTRKDLKYELTKAVKQLEAITGDDCAVMALKICAKLLMMCLKMLLNVRDNQSQIKQHLGIKNNKGDKE